jgi:hypothetical protein
MSYLLGLGLLIAGITFFVFGSRLYGQPKVGEQISVWRTLVPVLEEPAERFYARLYQALKASLQERLPDTEMPVEIVLTGMGFGPQRLFATPSLFAERPLYLLVRYQHLKCYIYAGQTPTGLFVSAWGYSDYHVGEGADQRLAFTKRAWSYFAKQTLFQFDAALMFTTAVHEILSTTVDAYREEEGLQPLEAMERRPVLHAFYQNPFYGNSFYREQQQTSAVNSSQPQWMPSQWSSQPLTAQPMHFNGNSSPPNPNHSVAPVASVAPMPQPLFAMDVTTPPSPQSSEASA